MSDTNKTFNDLLNIDVSKETDDKGGFDYLSWTYAWAFFKKACPDATYKVRMFDGKPYFKDDAGVMVFTEVSANGETHEMWLPAMDNRNNAVANPNMFQINKTMMRCFVKNIAMFGLGLSLYAGEDLPTDPTKKEVEEIASKALGAIERADSTSKLDAIKNHKPMNYLKLYPELHEKVNAAIVKRYEELGK